MIPDLIWRMVIDYLCIADRLRLRKVSRRFRALVASVTVKECAAFPLPGFSIDNYRDCLKDMHTSFPKITIISVHIFWHRTSVYKILQLCVTPFRCLRVLELDSVTLTNTKVKHLKHLQHTPIKTLILTGVKLQQNIVPEIECCENLDTLVVANDNYTSTREHCENVVKLVQLPQWRSLVLCVNSPHGTSTHTIDLSHITNACIASAHRFNIVGDNNAHTMVVHNMDAFTMYTRQNDNRCRRIILYGDGRDIPDAFRHGYVNEWIAKKPLLTSIHVYCSCGKHLTRKSTFSIERVTVHMWCDTKYRFNCEKYSIL